MNKKVVVFQLQCEVVFLRSAKWEGGGEGEKRKRSLKKKLPLQLGVPGSWGVTKNVCIYLYY